MGATLLGRDDPPAFAVEGEGDASPFVLICDHAGHLVPHALGSLALSIREMDLHIAWDLGVAEVARRLAKLLHASLIRQPYSRLVIDCNRPLAAADSIPGHSGGIFIAGNENLTGDEVTARQREIFQPYHDAIRAVLDRRAAQGQDSVLVLLHSFTKILWGVPRPWHIGILWNRDDRLAAPLLRLLRAEGDLVVGENEPYAAGEASDYSLIEHGEKRGLAAVEIEIRQDLIADDAGQSAWASRLARLLPLATHCLSPAQ